MTLQAAPLLALGRNPGLDALRAGMTLLVVFHHAAVTYGGQGDWFYREVRPSDAPASLVLTLFCAVNQAWFMGAFFLLAGYFAPPALARRGTAGFVRERLLRLGLPLLAFILLLGPLTRALAATSRGRPFLETLAALVHDPPFIPGPMWFVQALLLFTVAFLLWHGLGGDRAIGPVRPFPGDRMLLAAALATAVLAFLLRLAWPVGTTVAGMQPGYFASYGVLFAAGCLGAAGGWLERVPPAQMRRWRLVALIAIPVLPVAMLTLAGVAGSPNGGLSLPAVLYAAWEPFVAWGVILMALAWAQRPTAPLGRLGAALARRAYAIYLIHPPVLVGVALQLRPWAAPALVKFAVVGALASAACVILAGALLRLRPVARVL